MLAVGFLGLGGLALRRRQRALSACILNAVPPPQPYRRDNPFDLGSR
jgi:hypothetical protein